MSKINIRVKGSDITLTDKEYLAAGGEGTVYVKNGVAYKIYHDSTNSIPLSKIKELSVLNKSNILNPKDEIYDSKSKLIGYTTSFIFNTVPLSSIFTTSFRDRNGILPETSIKLVEAIIDTIASIHKFKIIMVDGNEMNYIVDEKGYTIPYFIDVDSYQTEHFPAKVIMPSIRDWHTKGFNELSDWFSFGIIATQIFIGIHPFKGTHPNYKRNDVESRMKANVSIFNRDVKLPPSVRNFDLIPKEFRNWLENIFEKGKRIPPPQVFTPIIITKPDITILIGSDKLDITEIWKIPEKIVGLNNFGKYYLYGSNNVYFSNVTRIRPNLLSEIVVDESGNNLVYVYLDNNTLMLKDVNTGVDIDAPKINVQKILHTDNRGTLYTFNNGKITEFVIKMLGSKLILGVNKTWEVLPNSSKLFKGCIISDVLGKCYSYIPFIKGSCAVLNISELDGKNIIDAKYEKGILILTIYEKGKYNRATVKFNNEFISYTVEIENDIIQCGINFAVLDTGVALLLDGEDNLILFSRKNNQKKIIKDVNLPGDAILCSLDNLNVNFYSGSELFQMKLKK